MIAAVFFSSIFFVIGANVEFGIEDESDDDEEEFCLDKDIFDNKSLSDPADATELFL